MAAASPPEVARIRLDPRVAPDERVAAGDGAPRLWLTREPSG
jgi:hypothetical protein